jgi:hypothetical protein
VISQKDVVVSYLNPDLSLPLRYYFGKNVFQVSTADMTIDNEVINRLYDSGAYDNVYVLTNDLYSAGYDAFSWERVGYYDYEFTYFSDGYHPFHYSDVNPAGISQFILPIKFKEENQAVYLYKLNRNNGFDITKELVINCGANGNLGMFVVNGFSYSEPDHTWTDGKTATLNFKITNSSSLQTDLNFTMTVNGFTYLVPYQRVTIYANSQVVYAGNIGGEYTAISVPIPVDLVRGKDALEIKFELPDASSSDLDPRVLGLSFKSISIMPVR